jgi:ribosomal protein S18 acetylase RimI-like enzyme
VPELSIRAMTPADAPVAIAWARAIGWRDRTRFYEFVFRVPTCQVLVGEVDGRVAVTGTAVAQGPVGWLGGLIVDPAKQRRGFGRAMTQELTARLRAAGCETLSLEATDEGLPMYERMGFRVEATYHQLEAGKLEAAPLLPTGARLRRMEPSDLPAVSDLDRRATAEDRQEPLRVLLEMNGGWVLERNDGCEVTLAGFLLPAERAYGAVIAPRLEDGLFLLDLHRSVIAEGATVRAGIPDAHGSAWRELQARGWRETWRAPRMLLGPAPEWRPDWIYGQINSAMG